MNFETILTDNCWVGPSANSTNDLKAHTGSNKVGLTKGDLAQNTLEITHEEKLQRYAKILGDKYDMDNLEQEAAVDFDDGTSYDFDFYHKETDTFIQCFDTIDLAVMQEYHELRKWLNILLLIDAERLPCAEFKDAHKFHGMPPMAFVAAVLVEAESYKDECIHRMCDQCRTEWKALVEREDSTDKTDI